MSQPTLLQTTENLAAQAYEAASEAAILLKEGKLEEAQKKITECLKHTQACNFNISLLKS